ncbi:MAG TPA: Flp pilus assembly protein CpaB [Elusimicrobia bacterium]|nr:Flp pilus assembly protein CpaB [Elusimicrobiota bacterium]
MEKKGVLIPLVLAMGAAIVYLMVLTSREKQLSQSYENATVLVSRVDLPERTLLKEDLVATKAVPRKFMEQDAIEIKIPSDIKQIANLVTRVRMPKGNQITKSGLTSLSPTSGLSVKIPPGYRGAVIPIESSLLELIKPGDRVDVLVTFDALMADNRKEKVTATILQNVLVLGVGNNLGQGVSAKEFEDKEKAEKQAAAFAEKGILSIALNPNEAQYLSLAMKQGEIIVIVRGLGDIEMHPMEMASFRKLFR